MALDSLTDEELIERARRKPAQAGPCLDVLYRRYYPKVAHWCLRVSGDRQLAGDLAQEVFLRVHDRLDSFRGDSRFSTWLYSVTRSVAINRGKSESRHGAASLDSDAMPPPVDPAPSPHELAARGQIGSRLREAMRRDLDDLEARVLYLHFVHGMTLPAITRMLDLRNRSGAKAYVVGGTRKLRRRFGRWLAEQSPEPRGEDR